MSRHFPRRRGRIRPALARLESRLAPALFTVNATNDEAVDTDGKLSLREAVLSANVAGTADTIAFDAGVFGVAQTINLSGGLGEILVSDALIVNGPAAKCTVNAGLSSRIFRIDNSVPGAMTVSMSALTLTNGKATGGDGGAVLIGDESVTFTSMEFNANQADLQGGAIATVAANLTVSFSTFSGNTSGGNGGAVCAFQGTVLIESSTLSGNSSTGDGGAICFDQTSALSPSRVQNSTLSANNGKKGGAIKIQNSKTRVSNATITDNTSTDTAGGMDIDPAEVDLISSIVFGNKGPVTDIVIDAGSTLNFSFSSVGDLSSTGTVNNLGGNLPLGTDPLLGPLANNGGPTLTHALLTGSPAVDAGANPLFLQFDQRGPGFLRRLGNDTDIGAFERLAPDPAVFGTFGNVPPAAPTYPIIVTYQDANSVINTATLDDNDVFVTGPGGFFASAKLISVGPPGASVTAAYELVPPGGAWDQADNGTYTISVNSSQVFDTDPAGALSVPGQTVGQLTVSIPSSLVVNATNDEVADTDGKLSLREAIGLANFFSGPDMITFDAVVFGSTRTITLVNGELAITEDVVIQGPGAALVTVSGNLDSRVFSVTPPSPGNVSISGMTLTAGNAGSGGGGAVDSKDTNLTLSAMVISASRSGADGGGIRVTNGGLTATACSFSKNSLSSTTVVGRGGGLALAGNATASITGCTFDGNAATATAVDSTGGAIGSTSTGAITIASSAFTNNSADGNAGFIHVTVAADLTVTATTIDNCNSTGGGAGGAIFLSATAATNVVTFRDSTISNCTTANSGGAFSSSGGSGTFNFVNCTFSNNFASLNGGAIRTFSAGTQTFNIQNCTFTLNKAGAAGGGINVGFGTFKVESSILAGNIDSSGKGRDLAGAFNIVAHSVIGNKGTATITTLTGGVIGSDAAPVNAKLGALTNNGGPTLTHAPSNTSPALDIGSNPTGLTNDQRGTGFPRTIGSKPDAGSVEIDPNAPTASATFADVTTSGGTVYPFTVTYTDKIAIKVASLDGADVRVTGPGGFNQLAKFISSVPAVNGSPVVATYQLTPPGGSFDPTDNGFYAVSVEAGQVSNTGGSFVAPAGLGAIRVAIPNNFVVDTTADETTANGKTSLREAVLAANASIAIDTISFSAAVFATAQTIKLSMGEMAITDSVTVAGPGAKLVTVDAAGLSRHFNVSGTGVLQVTLSGMTLTGGKVSGTGGGSIVESDENLTLSGMVLTGNTATDGDGGAINTLTNTSFLTIEDSILSNNSAPGAAGNGGAISNNGQARVTILRSTLAGNAAGEDGGAVHFGGGGGLTLTDSTLSGNTSNVTTAGKGGGAIYFFGTVVVGVIVTNSTISGNKAQGGSGGGICLDTVSNPFTIRNSTIASNDASAGGGGIARTGGVGGLVLSSTIVAGNTVGGVSPVTADLALNTLDNVSGDNNLIGVHGLGNNVTLTGVGNQSGSTATPLNPQLDPLGNYGGPTATHRLKAGSPAINQGNNVAGLANDQRGTGFARAVGVADVGAFEVQPAAPPTVTSVKVNGGGTQRSMVTSIVVTFSEAVTFPAGVNAAFQLARIGQPSGGPSASAPLGSINLTAVPSGNQVTVAFLSGGAVPLDLGGSLIDGAYQLTVVAVNVLGAGGQLDGDGNGTGGDNFLTPSLGSGRIARLFGDGDGDGDADALDYGAFRSAFGTANATFDFDADGDVDAVDYGQFRQRFGVSV